MCNSREAVLSDLWAFAPHEGGELVDGYEQAAGGEEEGDQHDADDEQPLCTGSVSGTESAEAAAVAIRNGVHGCGSSGDRQQYVKCCQDGAVHSLQGAGALPDLHGDTGGYGQRDRLESEESQVDRREDQKESCTPTTPEASSAPRSVSTPKTTQHAMAPVCSGFAGAAALPTSSLMRPM